MTESGGEEQATGDAPATPSVRHRQGSSADVFISYASADKQAADSICAALERAGIECWIAPRDVTPGVFYADAIVEAINSAHILIVVLSRNSVDSQHVLREVERASAKRRPLVAFRLDFAPLPTGLEYFLSASHWLDASGGPTERALPELVGAVHRLLGALDKRAGDSSIRDVRTVNASSGVAVARGSAPKPRWNRLWITAAVMTVVIFTLLAGKFWLSKHVATEQPATAATSVVSDKSVAVLPFTDMSEKHDQEYFADGMAEEIIDLLAKIPGLKVIGRTSSFQFKGKSDDLRTIGNALGVAYIVEGSVRRAGDRIRVTAQLINVQDRAHFWSETYDREVSDVLNVQAEIAASLARSLQIEVGGGADHRSGTPVRTDAYVAYLQGLNALSQFSRIGLDEAVSDFERALTLDPNLLRAREGLAGAHFLQYGFGFAPPTTVIPELRREIEEILRIDPRSVTGHGLRARILTSYDWDREAAQREADLVLSLDPSSGLGLYAAADLALVLGLHDKAEKLFRKVLSADPLDDDTRIELAFALSYAGRSAEAVEEAQQVLARHPSYTAIHYDVGMALLLTGNPSSRCVRCSWRRSKALKRSASRW